MGISPGSAFDRAGRGVVNEADLDAHREFNIGRILGATVNHRPRPYDWEAGDTEDDSDSLGRRPRLLAQTQLCR